jgi:hypothetical protein
MAATAPTTTNKTIAVLFLLFLALGNFFRVYRLGARTLWTDEAWVALAATQPTPDAVLQGGGQVAAAPLSVGSLEPGPGVWPE